VLAGSNNPEAFTISANGAIVAGNPLTFQGFEEISGGSGPGDSVLGTAADDLFGVSSSGPITAYGMTLTGFESFSGGGGTDRLQGADATNETFLIGPTGVSVLGTLGMFSDFEVLAGGSGGSDTLAGPSLLGGPASIWTITQNNAGRIAGYSFEDIETLRGGTGDDTFVLIPSATIGRIGCSTDFALLFNME